MKTDIAGGAQIPLAFSNYQRIDFDLYEPGENRFVLQHLKNIVSGQESGNVYLWGAAGSGKSHLLQAVCTAAAKIELAIAYVPLREAAALSPHLLDGLEQQTLVCIDDLDAIAGNAAWEQAIFHLYNRLRDARVSLLLTARQSPRGSTIQLPDLKSRLAWDPVFHLQLPGETASLRALQKRACARGFELPPEVAAYLLKRVARDTHSLFALLDKLDRASLVAKKKLTVAFVRTLLEQA